MNELLDDLYLEWLYDLVGRQEENVEHWRLLATLNSREFVMLVANDDNRCSDGKALRIEFRRAKPDIQVTREWLVDGCSVLEMMIGLARHLSFDMDGEIGEWFWHLIENLGLTRYNDKRFHQGAVDEIIERLVWRKYSYDGTGGLFPLKKPSKNQQDIEVWFQMEAYKLELERSV